MRVRGCALARLACAGACSLLVMSSSIAQERPDGARPPARKIQQVAAPAAVVVQPRPFGYIVGDLLTQRVLLEIDGHDVEPAELPRAERVDVWFERRDARIESGSDGRRWLVVSYQLINAPQALASVTLPAWELPTRQGNGLAIPAWRLRASPITSPQFEPPAVLRDLRPDHSAAILPTAAIRQQLILWSSGLLLTLLGWALWIAWRNQRASRDQPFARALRDMRGVDDSAPEAWQALHRAFDRTAGGVTHMGTLQGLFDRAPHLAPLRSRIEEFFAQSRELFFGGGLPGQRTSVHQLCADLRRIERRHER
jgi:mxaA protein